MTGPGSRDLGRLHPLEGAQASKIAAFCDRCGGDLTGADLAGADLTGADLTGADPHSACRSARALEPPRFCPYCRRRMKVQVLPAGWRAVCTEHGERSS